MNGIKDLVKKFILVAKPKDVKKGGFTCKNDSGGGLILKKGNRFVIIGRFFLIDKSFTICSRYCFWNKIFHFRLHVAITNVHKGE